MLNKTCKTGQFTNTFEEVKHLETLKLVNHNCLKIYELSIANNNFNYDNLKNLIINNIKNYVFSRKEVNNALENDESDQLYDRAIKKFREIHNNDDKGAGGELGELLLYIFLESDLKAYKLLSKMELKTSKNDYIKGSDGIFLYENNFDDFNIYNLIIGEAKLKNDLADGITDAFDSIMNHLSNTDFENGLINEHIFKETFSDEEAQKLRSLIVPSPQDYKHNISKNRAFGIFLGYSLNLDTKKASNIEAMRIINEKIATDIKLIASKLNKKIELKKLENYSFYIYILPFNKVDEDRKKIMEDIL